MTTYKEIISKLSDKELMELINDYQLITIPENSIVRKVVLECFGEINILVLQMDELLWVIVLVLKERFENYSPYISLDNSEEIFGK